MCVRANGDTWFCDTIYDKDKEYWLWLTEYVKYADARIMTRVTIRNMETAGG